LKANAGELGASALHHQARELEHLAKQRCSNELRTRLPEFSAQVQQACLALQRLRKRLTE
jgi:HPt (histidine-containing phosphotransfer) domain-containing protein